MVGLGLCSFLIVVSVVYIWFLDMKTGTGIWLKTAVVLDIRVSMGLSILLYTSFMRYYWSALADAHEPGFKSSILMKR